MTESVEIVRNTFSRETREPRHRSQRPVDTKRFRREGEGSNGLSSSRFLYSPGFTPHHREVNPENRSEVSIDARRVEKGRHPWGRFLYPPGFVPRHRSEEPVSGDDFIPLPRGESISLSEQPTEEVSVLQSDQPVELPIPQQLQARHARPVSRWRRFATVAAAGLAALGIRSAVRSEG